MQLQLFKIVLLLLTTCWAMQSQGQVTMLIEQLPKDTPLEDTIFISGTFNNWALNQPKYMLRKRLDGKYSVTLPAAHGSFAYKFHRGNWAKAETNERNEYLSNRKFTYGNGETVSVTIANWQDLGGAKPLDIFVFYFFAIAFHSIVTVYFITRIKHRRKRHTQAMMLFLAFVSFALVGRVFFEVTSTKWQFYIPLVGEVLLFLSGPLWYSIFSPIRYSRLFGKLHFLPVGLMLVVMVLTLTNSQALQFLEAEALGQYLTWDTLAISGLGWVSNGFYLWLSIRNLKSIRCKANETEVQFYKHLVGAQGLLLVVWLVKLFLLGQETMVFWYERDSLFVCATVFVILISFYVFKHEEIFRSVPIPQKSNPLKTTDLEELKNVVEVAMKEKKCFKNPHLTLNDLSEIVNIKPHLLSKIINEGYNQNFRDFVNKYRVEEFIDLAQQDGYKRYTFLALAYEVGFNSKSTYNAAFKKVTQQAPKDFFKANKLPA